MQNVDQEDGTYGESTGTGDAATDGSAIPILGRDVHFPSCATAASSVRLSAICRGPWTETTNKLFLEMRTVKFVEPKATFSQYLQSEDVDGCSSLPRRGLDISVNVVSSN